MDSVGERKPRPQAQRPADGHQHRLSVHLETSPRLLSRLRLRQRIHRLPGVRRGLQHPPAVRGRLRCDQSVKPVHARHEERQVSSGALTNWEAHSLTQKIAGSTLTASAACDEHLPIARQVLQFSDIHLDCYR